MTRHPFTRIAALAAGVIASGSVQAQQKPSGENPPSATIGEIQAAADRETARRGSRGSSGGSSSAATMSAVQAAAEREAARRQAEEQAGYQAWMTAGDQAMDEKDYARAFVHYQKFWTTCARRP